MLPIESPYDFRLRMLQTNPLDINDGSPAASDEYTIKRGATLVVPQGDVVYTAALDFCDFMLRSMKSPVMTACDGDGDIVVTIDESYKSYKCYRIETSVDGIKITAHDDRGAQQALFRLEEIMCERSAPHIKLGVEERAPLYAPRMTHSG